jgi:hypothetical protein
MKPFFNGIKSIIHQDFIFGTYFKKDEYLDGPRSIEFIREDCMHIIYSDIKSYKLKKVEQNYSNFSNTKEKNLKEFCNTLDAKAILIENFSFLNKLVKELPLNVKVNTNLIQNYIQNFCTYHSSIIDCIIFDFNFLFLEYNIELSEFEYKENVLLFTDFNSVVYEILKAYRNFFPDTKFYIEFPDIFNISDSSLNNIAFQYILDFYKLQLKNTINMVTGFSINSNIKDIDTSTNITTLEQIINICNSNKIKLLFKDIEFNDLNTPGPKISRLNLAKSKYDNFFSNLFHSGLNPNIFGGMTIKNLSPLYSPELQKFPGGLHSANSVFDEEYILTPLYRSLRTFYRILISIPE